MMTGMEVSHSHSGIPCQGGIMTVVVLAMESVPLSSRRRAGGGRATQTVGEADEGSRGDAEEGRCWEGCVQLNRR